MLTCQVHNSHYKGVRYSFPTPAKAANELVRFDRGETVRPFVLRLQGAVGSTRPISKKTAPKVKVDVTKILKGSRKAGQKKRSHGPHRGFRRAEGLRVIEA